MNRLNVVMILLFVGSPVGAQVDATRSALVPGAVVRISMSQFGPEPRIGTVLAASASSLEVTLQGFGGPTTQLLALSEIRMLELRTGQSRARGALIGAGVGAVVVGGGSLVSCSGECFIEGKEEYTVGVVASALLGAVVGGFIGSRVLVRSRWAVMRLGIS